MAHSTDIVAYTYRAEIICPSCIVQAMAPHHRAANVLLLGGNTLTTEQRLDLLAPDDIDRNNENTFDTDDFPKVVFRDQIESDERCARCGFDIAEGDTTHPRRLGGGVCHGNFAPHRAPFTGEPSMMCQECGFVVIDFAEDED